MHVSTFWNNIQQAKQKSVNAWYLFYLKEKVTNTQSQKKTDKKGTENITWWVTVRLCNFVHYKNNILSMLLKAQ